MKNYLASYQTNESVISEAMFKAENKKQASRLAQFHKRHTTEIINAGNGVKTYVYFHSKIN